MKKAAAEERLVVPDDIMFQTQPTPTLDTATILGHVAGDQVVID